jgi:hypothetical protein
MKMTLHRALAQRKTTKARLAKEIKEGTFIETTVGTSGKVKGTLVAEGEKNIQGSYDRIKALLDNLYKLSTAINRANNGIQDDTTNLHTVDFNGGQATLSSILAAQEGLRYRQQLVEKLTEQLAYMKNQVSRSEADVEKRCDQFLASMGGGDKNKLSAADIDSYSKNFHLNNDLKLVDPLGLEKLIEQLKERNEALDVESDSKISEINALTQVEVDLG